MKKLTYSIVTAAALAAFSAAPASAAIIEVGGDIASKPSPACALSQEPNATVKCEAVTRVTGYQIQTPDGKNPYRVTSNGRVFAASFSLPTLTNSQWDFFAKAYGGSPQVRLVVLRPRATKKQRYRYVVAGTSEKINLNPFLGSKPQIALERTLTVRRNDVVGVAIQTWFPAFATTLQSNSAWRASRASNRCGAAFLGNAAIHDRRGQIKNYGCLYRTAQLLYSATMLTDPKVTNRSTGK